MQYPNAPWLKFYTDAQAHLDYPDISMYDMLQQTAEKYKKLYAYHFMGKDVTYEKFIKEVHVCAKGLKSIGINKNDKVTICMPNCPQAVIMFYALNLIGAISSMVHPLSSEGELKFFLKISKSTALLTLDQFYPKIQAIQNDISVKKIIITSIKDVLKPVKKIGFAVTLGRKIAPIPKKNEIIFWNDFIKAGKRYTGEYICCRKGKDVASILYSGGTTGTTKGIALTNLNFNALSMQTAAAGDCIIPGHSMLAIMPIFHGFGLGVCIHTVITQGARCILIPQFSVKTYLKLLKKYKPNYIAGVPTLFEAMIRSDQVNHLDLSCLEGVFSGGDSLSIELKRKVDSFLKEHGATVQVREGYGTTECVTASCLTPKEFYKEGSIGIPFPDTYYKIVSPYTQDELKPGEIGEICICGPSVMKEYVDQPKETAQTLQLHKDGFVWLHTGDLGYMDEEGFVYFKQRLKRMIISSGYNIYPSQIENVIDAHEDVLLSTVIGVKDDYKMQKVKAFIVLKPGVAPTEEVRQSIKRHCEKNIAKYAMPYAFEFRNDLPKTLVGKVAYTVLEKEEELKQKGERV